MMMAVSLTFFGVVRHHSAAFLRATAPAAPLTVYESIATPTGSHRSPERTRPLLLTGSRAPV